MARRRTIQQIERDAEAVALRRENLTYRQIAKQLGFSSSESAYRAVKQGLADMFAESADELRQIELERLDELSQKARAVLHAQHFAVSNSGKIVCHPDTGEPLTDSGPVLSALKELRALGESRRKLLGLDAPTKVQSEVRHVDNFAVEIARLAGELAAGGAGPTPGHPEILPVADQGKS